MKNLSLVLITFCVIATQNCFSQTWNTTGNSGTIPGTNFIGTTDAKDFVFKTNSIERGRIMNSSGTLRFGGSSNNIKVDSTGSLTFSGTAAYKVAGNKYAFQYSGNPNYGLFFNSSSLLYEFRTSTALPIFSVGANSGNGIFKGNLKVGAYTLPATDGTIGQLLKTNGTGTLTWSDDNNTSYTPGTGISFAGSTINSNWTTATNDIYNNNSGSVGIGGAPFDLTFKLNVVTNGYNGINVSDPVDGYALYCVKSGINQGIYINKNYTGGAQTTTAAIEAHVNSANNAIEGLSTQGGFGALGGYNGVYATATSGAGVYGYSETSNGVFGSANNTGTGVSANNVGTGNAIYASALTGQSIYGTTGGSISASFTTNYAGIGTGLKGIFSAVGSFDGYGVYGEAITTNPNYGYGGYFKGNYRGVYGTGVTGGSTGVYANAGGATYGIYCNGNFGGTGVNSYSSDRKLKTNIQPINTALDKIMQLKPSSYEFRVGQFGDMFLPDGNHFGLIAQDLQAVFPELVIQNKFYNDDKSSFDYLSVNYQELIPILISAIQEQEITIDSLKTLSAPVDNTAAYQQQIAEQNQQIADLNSKLDAMMNKMNNFESSLSQCCSSYQSTIGSNQLSVDAAKLEQNVPNPFMQNCYIKFYIPSTAKNAFITINDLTGRTIKTFSNLVVGFGTVNINGGELAAGEYLYTLTIDGNKVDAKKMILTK